MYAWNRNPIKYKNREIHQTVLCRKPKGCYTTSQVSSCLFGFTGFSVFTDKISLVSEKAIAYDLHDFHSHQTTYRSICICHVLI